MPENTPQRSKKCQEPPHTKPFQHSEIKSHLTQNQEDTYQHLCHHLTRFRLWTGSRGPQKKILWLPKTIPKTRSHRSIVARSQPLARRNRPTPGHLPGGSPPSTLCPPCRSHSPNAGTSGKRHLSIRTRVSKAPGTPRARPSSMNAMDLLLRDDPGFFRMLAGTTASVAVRYLLVAGLAWLLGYGVFRNRWIRRKIIERFPAASDIRRELLYSALSMFIFGVVGALTFTTARAGWTQVYWDLDAHGSLWFLGTIATAILLHDTYFYWTHRMMHHPRLFRWFHRVHHESTNPSPWASYSFAPLEALVQALIFPLVAVLIPIHPFAMGLFTLWQIIFIVAGHTGYEFNPRGLMQSRWRFLLNTPTNHVMHHEKMRGNFGLYFNFWDRLMGTDHPGYEDRFREVTGR